MSRAWLAGALCLVLAACQPGRDAAPPTAGVPEAYRFGPASGPGTISAAWWRGFGSAELDALMQDADRDSFDIAAAVARVQQADQALRAAGASLLPTVQASAKQSWDRSSVTTTRLSQQPGGGIGFSTARRTLESRSYSLGPSVSYELDLWGGVAAARDAAAAAALFSRYDRETVRLTVLTSVATAWINALAYQDRLAVTQRNLRDAEQILQAIRARQDAGTASLLDVSQQEALVAGIRAQMPALRQQRDQQVTALAVLTGRLPERIPMPEGSLDRLTIPELRAGLPSTLLARRPDVASAEANLLAQNANIRVARAAFFPTIDLTGSAGWQSTALSTLFNPGSTLLNAASSATQVIFDNGRLGAQYAQAKARRDELVAEYRRAVVQAFTDVENGLDGLRETTEQERLEREAVATAQRAADIARAQVLAGTLDIVTALQTQTTLFNDLELLTEARQARFQAVVNLYKALGGGWSRADVTGPATPIFNGVL